VDDASTAKQSHPNRECESDQLLVRKALGGDADAFATLFQLHKGRVYAICLRMTNNPADADDLTQEAFIQAFRKLGTFRGESALSTWLHRVAVNTALMHFRRHPTHKYTMESCADPEAGKREIGRQDDRLRHSLDRIALTRALETLPSGYRTIFELHEIGGYGHREIARILRCSVGNSKSQLHKAKQKIRECLVARRQLRRYAQKEVKPEAMRNPCSIRSADLQATGVATRRETAQRKETVREQLPDAHAGVFVEAAGQGLAETAA
jgi:RNA polymerase sigma-70 factor (ECF subfamily)